jgi:2-polyprenyl-3-methyl-5-hydroxy-6-metoxy-1,4-benzoquinol methylase/Flp pilus assembly protein TadD
LGVHHLQAVNHLAQAIRLHRTGNLTEAEALCRAIIATRPDSADAWNLLGMIAAQRGDLDASASHLGRALALAPGNAVILSNLAETLRRQRKALQAVPLLRQAVAIAPEFADAHLKLAVALIDSGRPDDALAACRAGLILHPENHHLNGLAAGLLIERRSAEAAPYLFTALERAPNVDRYWEQLGRFLSFVSLPPTDAIKGWLLRALSHPVIRPGDISASIANVLCADPAIAGLIELAERGDLPRGPLMADRLSRLGSDELLLTLMASAVIPSPRLERLFTGLRRALLLEVDARPFSPGGIEFCSGLAVQAFLTDYAWYVTDEEENAIETLASRIDETIRHGGLSDLLPGRLAVLAAYRPLHTLRTAQDIARMSGSPRFSNLIGIQVKGPLEERVLRAEIPRLTPISNEVSQEVRALYEENPYPRWVRATRAPEPVYLPSFIANLGGQTPADASFATPDVLVAGCGTGQHPLFAASFYKDAKVVAIDLSLESLGYALRKTRESGVMNIEYAQADILELGGLDRRFHVIESGGVLHHLADPIAGWRVLVDLLRPQGLMNIAVYSEIARRTVVKGREYIANRGYQPTAADIRRFRRDILTRPDDDPLAPLRSFKDLFNISECRDLLFHVQEHRFTLPQIKQALADLGLRFLGFRYPPNAAAYRQRFPDDPHMRSLDNWHVFEQENPDSFIAMYNFWAQKI